MTRRPSARTAEPRPTLEVHDNGCRCWPHVSEKDALACIADAAHAEYREGLRRAAAPAGLADAAHAEYREGLRRAAAPAGLDVLDKARQYANEQTPTWAWPHGEWLKQFAAEYDRLRQGTDA